MSGCSIRPTLIDLRSMFSNNSDVIQVVPDHITVDKCGGSCYIPPHSCNPATETKMKVQVMLVLSKWPHGEHETLTEEEVEVHHQCQCGCQVQPEQCLPDLQYIFNTYVSLFPGVCVLILGSVTPALLTRDKIFCENPKYFGRRMLNILA